MPVIVSRIPFPLYESGGPALRLTQRILWSFFALNLLGLLGTTLLYFGGPHWLQRNLPVELEQRLGRPVRLAQVWFEPAELKITLQGLELLEATGSEVFFGLNQLSVDLSWSALLRGELLLEEVRLQDPVVRVSYLGGQRFNFSDLLQRFESSEPTLASESSSSAFPLEVRNLTVQEGTLVLTDQTQGLTQEIAGLNFRLPSLSALQLNSPAEANQPTLEARLGESSLRIVATELSLEPGGQIQLQIGLQNLYLPSFQDYLPKDWPLALRDGSLTAELRLSYQNTPEETLSLSGRLNLQRLHLQSSLPDQSSQPLLELESLELPLSQVQLLPALQLELGTIALGPMELWLRRDEEGAFLWDSFTPADPANTTPTGASPNNDLRVLLQGVRLPQATIHVSDAAVEPELAQDWQLQEARIGSLNWPPIKEATPAQLQLQRESGPSLSWQGQVQLTNFASQGKVQLQGLLLEELRPYLQEPLPVSLSGELSLQTQYAWNPSAGLPVLSDSVVELKQLQVLRQRETWLRLEQLRLEAKSLQLPRNQISLTKLTLERPEVLLRLDAENRSNWQTLWAPSNAAESENAPASNPSWQLRLDQFQLRQGVLNLEQTLSSGETVQKSLSLREVSLDALGWPLRGQTRTRLQLETADQEEFALDGVAEWERSLWRGALRSNLDLTQWRPYFEEQLPWTLESGRLRLALQLAVNWDSLQVQLDDSALTVQGLRLTQPRQDLPRIALEDFSVRGVQLRWPQTSLRLDALAIRQLDLQSSSATWPTLTLGSLASTGLDVQEEAGKGELAALQLQSLSLQENPEAWPKVELGRLSVTQLSLPWQQQQFSWEELRLAEGSLIPVGESEPVLTLPELQSGSLLVNWQQQSASLSYLQTANAKVRLAVLPEGEFSTSKWFPASMEKEDPEPPPWQFELQQARLGLDELRWQDQQQPTPPIRLSQGLLQLTNLSTESSTIERFDLRGRLGARGRVALSGSTRWLQDTEMTVDFEDFDLLDWQPYWIEYVPLELQQGFGTLRGHFYLKHDFEGEWLRYQGLARIRDGHLVLKESGEDMGIWQLMEAPRLRLEFDPFVLDFGEMLLTDFQLPVRRQVDGDLQWVAIFTDGEEDPEPAEPKDTEPGPVFLPELVVVRGGVLWEDQSNAQPVKISLQKTEGTLANLVGSRRPLQLNLQGYWEGVAPLDMNLALDWNRDPLSLNGTFQTEDFDLLWVSPYSERYLGYELQRGHLSLDLEYKTRDTELDARNHLLIQKFVLGRPTPNADAIDAPIQLALNLLRDSDGTIELSLPVHGDWKDPEFGLGDATFKVFVGLLRTAVTAPFSLVSEVISSNSLDENTQVIRFQPGSLEIPEAERLKLAQLREVLRQRPQLRMELTTLLQSEVERKALREQELERLLRREKVAALVRKQAEEELERGVSLSPEERGQFLELLFTRRFGEPSEQSMASLRQYLLEQIEVADADLEALALQRAYNVRNLLLAEGVLAAEQIKLYSEVEPAPSTTKSSRVELRLRP